MASDGKSRNEWKKREKHPAIGGLGGVGGVGAGGDGGSTDKGCGL